MKIFFTLILILFATISFCLGQKNLNIDLSTVTNNGEFQNNTITFPKGEGEISVNPELLKNRVYKINIDCDTQGIKGNIYIKFQYKFAFVGEYKNNFNLSQGTTDITQDYFLKIPKRFDKILLKLNFTGKIPFSISKISFNAYDEPLCYGYFINPFYEGNAGPNIKTINFRYFSNHNEIEKEDEKITHTVQITDEKGKILFKKTDKNTFPNGYESFEKPNLPTGKYIFQFQIKEGDTILSTYELPFNSVDKFPDFYCDENGRLIHNKKPVILIGLTGNTDRIDFIDAKKMGVNACKSGDFEFIFDKNIKIFNTSEPWDILKIKANKSINIPYIVNIRGKNPEVFGPLIHSECDFLSFNFNENPFEKIKSFFNDYGYYYPLINEINLNNDNYENIFWETLAQSQSGIIFNISQKEDFEKIKPFLLFLKENNNIILSNETPNSLVFGNIYYFIRKYNNFEYIYIFETKGQTGLVDIFTPNKKDKVFLGDTQLISDKKEKKKYSLTINPFSHTIIKIELEKK